ncbi:MAG TPA: choice-of-anchor tandem repeat GloVer-containing protein [Stellaceae bacterium]|nr:choice-of-anchor tandem repeat GloVer-containing protein [Stellaceae bacterium]
MMCSTRGLYGLALIAAFTALPAGAATTEQLLYSLATHSGDGSMPYYSGVVSDGAGHLYGTTLEGGAQGQGAVFRLTRGTDGYIEDIIWSFAGGSGDGSEPVAGLIRLPTGALIGTTEFGGAGNCSGGCGVVFELLPPAGRLASWQEIIIHDFAGAAQQDGATPIGTLFQRATGEIIGTTAAGGTGTVAGANGAGMVFSLIPPSLANGAWTETIVHNFAGGTTDGAVPFSGVIHKHGAFYGTTFEGGSTGCGLGCGAVYQLLPPAVTGGTWEESMIYAFRGSPTDGDGPYVDLVAGASGTLYGTTTEGGSGTCTNGCGTVFQLVPGTTGWTESLLVDFANQAQGQNPFSPLSMSPMGQLIGTTANGGRHGAGNVFSLGPANSSGARTFTDIYDFAGGTTDAALPAGPLVLTDVGAIIGTSQSGGTASKGTVYRIRP